HLSRVVLFPAGGGEALAVRAPTHAEDTIDVALAGQQGAVAEAVEVVPLPVPVGLRAVSQDLGRTPPVVLPPAPGGPLAAPEVQKARRQLPLLRLTGACLREFALCGLGQVPLCLGIRLRLDGFLVSRLQVPVGEDAHRQDEPGGRRQDADRGQRCRRRPPPGALNGPLPPANRA